MDKTKTYIKMCDNPWIQKSWKPEIGDYLFRKYSVFGEPLDTEIWKDKNKPEITILSYHNNDASEYYSGATLEGESRIVLFPDSDSMIKATYIWLPTQDRLQGMLGFLGASDIYGWLRRITKFQMLYPFQSYEQLWLAFVMKEKWNKVWNGEYWVDG